MKASSHDTTLMFYCAEANSPGAKSRKINQTRFCLPNQVTDVSWFYVIETPTETII